MSIKALLLDYDRDLWPVIRLLLEMFCSECKCVESVEEALAILRTEEIDVVIVHEMNHDSWQVHDVLYCANPKATLPGIIVWLPKIEFGSVEDAKRFWNGLQVRGIERLYRPFDVDELLAKIIYLLKKSGKSLITQEERSSCFERNREQLKQFYQTVEERDLAAKYNAWIDRVEAKATKLLWIMRLKIDEQGVTCYSAPQQTRHVLWSDLHAVYVDTTDEGPFVDDVFFVLIDSQGECRIPQTTPESANLLRRLQSLPGFDNESIIQAMTCSDNRRFVCWQRSA